MTLARLSMMIAVLGAVGCERAPDGRGHDRRAREASPGAGCPVLAPRPPRPQPADPSPLAPSSIAISIPIALAPFQPMLDRLIPSLSDPDWSVLHPVNDAVCATWLFERRPIMLAMDGARLRVAIPGELGMIASPNLGPLGCTKPVVRCGDRSTGTPPLAAQLNLSATLGLGKDYRVQAGLHNDGTTLQQPCNLIGNLNTSPVVTALIDDQIDRRLPALSAAIASKADLRPPAEAAWTAIQRPQKLGDGLWLVVRPATLDARVSSSDPGTLSVQIVARGAIALVQQVAAPAAGAAPLPELTATAPDVAPGVHIGAAGTIGYDSLTRQLRGALVGKDETIEYPAGTSHRVVIRDVQLTGPVKCKTNPDGSKCISLAVELAGDVCGTVYLVGRPAVDSAARELGLADLELSLTTSDAIVNTAAWLAHGALREQVQREARISLAPAATEAQRRLNHALQSKAAGEWRLSGKADTVTVQAIAGTAGLDYAIDLSGALTVSLAVP